MLPISTSERRQHHKKRGAESEFFADQVGKAFAGDHAHARAHFFGDVERDGHGNQRPEQRVAELRAGDGVDGDSAGVVVHVGGDEPGADDGQKQSQAPPHGRVRLLIFGGPPGARACPLTVTQRVHFTLRTLIHVCRLVLTYVYSFARMRLTTSSTVIAPTGQLCSIHHRQAAQIVFIEKLKHFFILERRDTRKQRLERQLGHALVGCRPAAGAPSAPCRQSRHRD